MKYFVTGGAGFIGSHLVDALVAHGDEVFVVDDLSTGSVGHLHEARLRGQVQVFTMDIRDPDLAIAGTRFSPDVVVHLAAQASVRRSLESPVVDADINILGTLNVLEMARKAGAKRVVYTSSGGAIRGAGSKLPAKESHVPRPEAPYGVSKLVSIEYLSLYKRAYGIDYVALLPSNVYGPRQSAGSEGGVVSIFIEALLAAHTPTIFGDGKHTRDFVYVQDVVRACLAAAQVGGGRMLHISSGRETSIGALYSLIQDLTGGPEHPHFGPAKEGDILRSVLDPAAALKHLGWSADTSLAAGLAETVDWFRSS